MILPTSLATSSGMRELIDLPLHASNEGLPFPTLISHGAVRRIPTAAVERHPFGPLRHLIPDREQPGCP